MEIIHDTIEMETGPGIGVYDITSDIRGRLQQCNIVNGMAVINSQHTTTALVVNEFEERLVADIKTFFTELIPADRSYLHNDIHLRDCSPDEPENAHSHLIAMLLSQSEMIPLVEGELQLGVWQSVLFVEQQPSSVNIWYLP